MKKLAQLIIEYLLSFIDVETAFKNYARARLAEIEFDPDAEQDALTDLQQQWLDEVLAEANAS